MPCHVMSCHVTERLVRLQRFNKHNTRKNANKNSQPASREYVAEIFHLLDTDDSGTLTKEEFTIVMKILYSQVLTRIVIQWTLTLMSEWYSNPLCASFLFSFNIVKTVNTETSHCMSFSILTLPCSLTQLNSRFQSFH